MKILITGASGFTGRYLEEYLTQNSHLNIYGTSRTGTVTDHFSCDLTNAESVNNLILQIKPEKIYHLAGSFSNDYDIDYANNVLATKNILDSILKLKVSCRVLLVGSAAEYGFIQEEDNPVTEDHPLNPVSIYGLTKVYQTHLMKFYCQVHDLDIVMARLFNLLGENISPKLFIGRIYQQIEEYKSGKIDKIILGDLQSKRDYINIQEAIKYYDIVMNYGKKGEIYNVGSGTSIKISDLLEKILLDNDLKMDMIEIKLKDSVNKLNVNDIFADLSKVNLLIEDNAQGIGSTYKDKPLGSFGDLSALSFHETKNLISGEGGALIINAPSLVERSEIIWEKGTNRSQFFRGQVAKYTWVDLGSSYLPSELIAAFLWAQFEAKETILNQRLAIWQTYNQVFQELQNQGRVRLPIIPIHCKHNAHLYYLLLNNLEERTELIQYLMSDQIQSVFHYIPLHSSPGGLKYGRVGGTMENTNTVSDCLLRLPLWINLDKVERIIELVFQYFQK